jgi:hypothetical protein
MKNLFRAANCSKIPPVTKMQSLNRFLRSGQLIPYVMIVVASLLFSACKKYDADKPQTKSEERLSSNNGVKPDQELLNYYRGLNPQTLWELQQVRAATAKYQNINNAFGDSYVDIGLVMPNMGYHFLKAELITPVFDLRKPPILVYNKKDNGDFELVAVEYAVPINPQSPNTPPEGFTGNDDMWDFNTLNTGWWTLHAWVWKNNPDGVFNMTNPLVIVQ